MAICCCSMAGTSACKHCKNNYDADFSYGYRVVTTNTINNIQNKSIETEVIGRLNQHISDLQNENKMLKENLFGQ